MRLNDLEPRFLKHEASDRFRCVDSIEGADGVKFLCPVCFAKNKGAAGTHAVICWQPHVPQDTRPTPGRWAMAGSSYADLSLVAGSSSVKLSGGCGAHFFVRHGLVELC